MRLSRLEATPYQAATTVIGSAQTSSYRVSRLTAMLSKLHAVLARTGLVHLHYAAP